MKNILLFILLFQLSAVLGQEHKWFATKIDTIHFHADQFIGYDSFGYYYYIKNNVLIKKTSSKIWQYKNLALGKISKVDIQNPLNIVLFYDFFNTIILLDNQLNETQKIDLSENATPILATSIGIAFGNRLWIYNSLSQQIGLFNFLKSDYRAITTPFKDTIKQYTSDYNSFQWIDEKQNWFYCNIYGNITPLGKVPDYDKIQIVSHSDLLYTKDNSLYYFTLIGNKSTLIDLDKKTFKKFYYKDQILTIFTDEGITNYKINKP